MGRHKGEIWKGMFRESAGESMEKNCTAAGGLQNFLAGAGYQ